MMTLLKWMFIAFLMGLVMIQYHDLAFALTGLWLILAMAFITLTE